jgi:tetratricopeptide (TPR) repeat protein
MLRFNRDDLLRQQAEASIMASRCCYLRGDLATSINLAKEATLICPEDLRYGMQLAKLYVANGQASNAAEALISVIKKNKSFFKSIFLDADFFQNTHVVEALESFANSHIDILTNRINILKSDAHPNGQALPRLNATESHFHDKTYLNAIAINKRLDREDSWQYMVYSFYNCETLGTLPSKNLVSKMHTLERFIDIENKEFGDMHKYEECYKKAVSYSESQELKRLLNKVYLSVAITIIGAVIVAFTLGSIIVCFIVAAVTWALYVLWKERGN